jgi:8-oxo-dGTP pyrophosphatase MutT (NUDIX family)
MHSHLIALLEAHEPYDDRECHHKEQALEFIRTTPHCASRDTAEGHVTASAWVLSPDLDAVLLMHHKKLDRWLQLGGHVENDASIEEAALREAREESGIEGFEQLGPLFDIDAHVIPARGREMEHTHFDFRFVFQALTSDFIVNNESIDLAWVKLQDMDSGDESISRMARKTIPFLATLKPDN